MSAPTPSQIQYQIDHIHQSKVPSIIATCVICLFIAYVGVLLRLMSRRVLGTSLKADDWAIILSLLFTTGYISIELVAVRYGEGRHAVLVKDVPAFVKSLLAAGTVEGAALLSIKCSILILYDRIFPGQWFHRILWAVGIFSMATQIVQIFSGIFQCVPIEAAWNPAVEGHCINLSTVLVVGASMDIVTDFVILLLPMPQLWCLQVSTKQKIQLTGIFLLGGVTCFTSLIRVPKLKGVSLVDPSWSDAPSNIWGIIEVGVGTLSACLPTLRPLFNYVFYRKTAPTGVQRSYYNEPAKDFRNTELRHLSQLNKGLNSSTTVNSVHPLVHVESHINENDIRKSSSLLEKVHIQHHSCARYNLAVHNAQDQRGDEVQDLGQPH